MKKLILHCFLGKLCPYPNRSRSISRSFVSYFSNKGGVFRQPQADISQERSDFISQAKGLPISNFLYQKWFLQTCLFLSILSSSINEVSSQVACSPPGFELVDCPGFPALAGSHRSGETRSDTFYSITPQDIDGGPGHVISVQNQLVGNEILNQTAASPLGAPRTCPDYFGSDVNESAVDCSLKTDDYNEKGFSLVDSTVSLGQEGAIPSAPSGALIYGEIINPDSLTPLEMQVSEYKFLPRVSPSTYQLMIEPELGQFLDGVLSHKIKKFRMEVPTDQPAYVSITLQERVLLEDYLLFPTDSVMLSLNLETMQIVFAGPSAPWLNAQYLIKRGEDSDTFDSRILLDNDRETYLDKNGNRAAWEQYKSQFGPELKILNIGQDGADYAIRELMDSDYRKIPGYQELQQSEPYLDRDCYELLKAELLGNYFSEKLKKFRQYQYGIPQVKGQQQLLDQMDRQLPALSKKILADIKGLKPSLISTGYNALLSEWVKLERLHTGASFEAIAKSHFDGEVLDRLLTGNLVDRIPYDATDWQSWEQYAEAIHSEPWKGIAGTELELYRTGQPVASVVWQDLDGREWSPSNFLGEPTLFYFYFSTCTHSANYFKNYLWPMYQELAGKVGFRLVAVSADNDQDLWRAHLREYSNPELLNLNFSMDKNSDWLERYHIRGYPSTLLMDEEGKLLSYSLKGENYQDYKERFLQLINK